MRKTLLSLCLALFAATMVAAPAKRGIYRTLRLADGTEVKAQLCGDEHMRFFRADEGTCYVSNGDGTYAVADMDGLRSNAQKRREPLAKRMGQRLEQRIGKRMAAIRNANATVTTPTYPELTDGFYGKKRGIIILAQFPDQKFATNHTQAFYEKLANKENYTEGNFLGSVHDYFNDQSNGQFDLTFDVVGPVTLSKNSTYYGQNDSESDEDMYAGEMVAEACKAVKDKVDWSQYDWDGDGEADQVFVLYAGYGEADYGSENTVWPHMYWLSESDYGKKLDMNGTTIDTYACSNELTLGSDGQPTDDGIGTFCHEFSHCMGFPDLYDTSYKGGYGMGSYWDLMHGGNTNGSSYCPSGYTGLEKWIAGWATPVLLTKDTEVSGWKACSEGGQPYIFYNDANSNEFYIIDNRQQTGWDAALPGKGLLVTHIDYNKSAWQQNTLNNTKSHQRWSIIAADNSYFQAEYADELEKEWKDAGNDAYPYKSNNSLSQSSTPKNTVFNKNTDGTYFMNKALTDITQNSDGTMSFKFKIEESSAQPDTPDTPVRPGDAVFYESFNNCNGKGGNDGYWSGSLTNTVLSSKVTDNAGWKDLHDKCYVANKCARFGNKSTAGYAITPSFTITGDAQLTFKAGAWKAEGGNIEIYCNDELILTKNITDEQWTTVVADFTGPGNCTLSFRGKNKRFFLDEVTVKSVTISGISSVEESSARKADGRIFTIDGRFIGTDKEALPKGLYIMNGKKFVK